MPWTAPKRLLIIVYIIVYQGSRIDWGGVGVVPFLAKGNEYKIHDILSTCSILLCAVLCLCVYAF